MGNEPKKEWSLEELKEKARPALKDKALVGIAATSPSPNQAAFLAEKQGMSKELVQSCRWLAIIKRDYPEEFKKKTKTKRGRGKMTDPKINAAIPVSIEFRVEADQLKEASLEDLKERIVQIRTLLKEFDIISGPNIERTVHVGAISVGFPLDYSLHTSVIGSFQENQTIKIKRGSKSGSVSREENDLGLGAQTRESRIKTLEPILIVDLFPHLSPDDRYDHRFTDRGVCWVHPGSSAWIHMEPKDWTNEDVTPEELVGFVKTADQRTRHVIDTVLNSN